MSETQNVDPKNGVDPQANKVAHSAETNQQADSFSQQAEEAPPSLIVEFLDFLRYNKKWWLTPIILILLLFGLLIIFSGTAAAPFIYTVF